MTEETKGSSQSESLSGERINDVDYSMRVLW